MMDDFDRDEARYGPDATVCVLGYQPTRCVKCKWPLSPERIALGLDECEHCANGECIVCGSLVHSPESRKCLRCLVFSDRPHDLPLPWCPKCGSKLIDCISEDRGGFTWQCFKCGNFETDRANQPKGAGITKEGR